MKALSIRQPWAWMILHAGKDIENRTWPTRVRGNILIHASKGMTLAEYEEACEFAEDIKPGLIVPAFDMLQRGGIVGMVAIIGCVSESESKWFGGPFGFTLAHPYPLPFESCAGQLGFFEVSP